jgi:hypothetical protein
MSYPAISNVQYRLTEENGITRLKFTTERWGRFLTMLRSNEAGGLSE